MILFKKEKDLRKHLDLRRKEGEKIGFVPTMGALHAGHISLLNDARKDNEVSVVSIFVNPTQFNDPADFEKYPVTIETDIAQLEAAGCDILFLPSVSEIYPTGTTPQQEYDLGYLETLLEGKFRPGHFQGVCMVVHRLLSMVMPGNLYMGQKDYQQCMVIRRLLEITGLEDNINLHISPTLREPDGLAMSSRNMRLKPSERATAVAIFGALSTIKQQIQPGDIRPLKEQAVRDLSTKGFRPDYIEIADAVTLQPITGWDGKLKIVALAAAFLGDVRLIDNLLLN